MENLHNKNTNDETVHPTINNKDNAMNESTVNNIDPNTKDKDVNTASDTVANNASDNTDKQGTNTAPVELNLLDLLTQTPVSAVPEVIRLGADDKALIVFTPTSVRLKVHFCEESEIRSYVHCHGDSCLLCRAGKHADERVLLPVVAPAEHRIGLLMMSTSMRPGALLYQILQHLKTMAAGTRQVLFIRRDGNVFTVSARALRDGEDDGAALIKTFMIDMSAGKVDLRQAVQTLTDEQILAVPSIHDMLVLKGVIQP